MKYFLKIFSLRFILLQLRFPPKIAFCVLCNHKSLFIRTHKSIRIGTRCIKCGSTAHHRGIIKLIKEEYGQNLNELKLKKVYEISAHGALFNYFKNKQSEVKYNFYCSEYLDNWIPGKFYNGVRCENIENSTFEDNFFNLITSTAVMEHVENDIVAYKEIFRILKSGCAYIFTIPLMMNSKKTIIRARRNEKSEIENFLDPEYHSDPFRGENIFTWRNYGTDITDTLNLLGFTSEIKEIFLEDINEAMPVIIAKKM